MIDFVKFLNNELKFSAAKKQSILDDLAEYFGYTEFITDGMGNSMPNQVSKVEWVNQNITNVFREWIESTRKRRAEKIISIEKVEF
jgi:hypothetical protein